MEAAQNSVELMCTKLDPLIEDICGSEASVRTSMMRLKQPSKPYCQGRNLRVRKDCEFDALEEELIKDIIICGVKSDKVRTRLLQTSDLSLGNSHLAELNAES
jgi:hypothetical protein